MLYSTFIVRLPICVFLEYHFGTNIFEFEYAAGKATIKNIPFPFPFLVGHTTHPIRHQTLNFDLLQLVAQRPQQSPSSA